MDRHSHLCCGALQFPQGYLWHLCYLSDFYFTNEGEKKRMLPVCVEMQLVSLPFG